MRVRIFFLSLVIGTTLFIHTNAQQNQVSKKAIFKGFYQTNKANCAYVAAIKAAISVFGTDSVFRETTVDITTGNTLVFLRDRFLPIVIEPGDIQKVRARSGFRKGDNSVEYSKVYEFALLSYAVMAKVKMEGGGTFDEVLREMEEGADVVEAAALLGLKQFAKRKRLLSSTAGLDGAMVGGKKHAAFVCYGDIDLWGKTKRLHLLRLYWRRAVIERPKYPRANLVASVIDWKKDTLNSISGIDRDEQTGALYFVSDHQYNRVYRGDLRFVRDVTGNLLVNLALRDSLAIVGTDKADEPESVRIAADSMYVATERLNTTELYSGALSSGAIAVNKMTLPAAFAGELTKNSGIEALTFSPDKKQLWMVLERPFNDPESGTMIPFVRKIAGKDSIYQYPLGPCATKDCGVTEILSCGENEFIALEREYNGKVTATIYYCSFTSDGYILKQKLLDFRKLPLERIDNFEAMTWGPRLPGGARSLIVVSDNNMYAGQTTDVLVFAFQP